MFKAYYSKAARDLADWAENVNDRFKATHISRAAQTVEERYRREHPDIVQDPYCFPIGLIPKPPRLKKAR